MFKNKRSGAWEHEFQIDGLPRTHLSYGKVKKDAADRLHAVALALFKSKNIPVIQALKDKRVTLEQLAQLRDEHRPFSDALPMAKPEVEPWPSLGDAVERYIKGIERNTNRAEGTARSAQTQLNAALRFFGPDVRIDAITTERSLAYQEQLVNDGKETNTITTYMARFGAMYRWFIKRENVDARERKRTPRVLYVPLDAEEISSAKTRRERFLKVEEVTQLLAVTPQFFRFPVGVGIFAGLRMGEMCHLRPQYDIDLSRNILRVQRQDEWKPKTPKSVRHVPLNGQLRILLMEHLERFSSAEWVTPSSMNPTAPIGDKAFAYHFDKIVRAADMEKSTKGKRNPEAVTYHTLRHTFASHLLMAGSDVYTVSQLLGNSVKQVEQTYGHLSQDHKWLAVDGLDRALGPVVQSTAITG